MASSYTTLLGLVLPVQGELIGTWGDTVNAGLTQLLDSSIAGTTTLSTDADVTLTTTTGAANQARAAILNCTGARTAQRTVTAPAQSKAYFVINGTSGGFATKIVGVGPTTGVTVAAGETCIIAWNGSDFVKMAVLNGAGAFTTLSVSGTTTLNSSLNGLMKTTAGVVSNAAQADVTALLGAGSITNTMLANGAVANLSGTNTGDETGSSIRTKLGTTTVGANFNTLANPGAVRYTQINADNTVTALDAATFRANIGAGTSSSTGTVTTVSVASANGFGGSVATATTTPAITLTTSITGLLKGSASALVAATAGSDYVAPNGALGTPSSGNLANCTFPTLNQNTSGNAATATTASSVAWTGVTGRPTAVSAFTNDSGYVTSAGSVTYATTAGRAYPYRSDGTAINFYWSGQSGQPTWLWGGNDGVNMYVYNPSNFSVSYAATAGSASANGGYADSAGYAASSNTANYATTAGTVNTVPTPHTYTVGAYCLCWCNDPSHYPGAGGQTLAGSTLYSAVTSGTYIEGPLSGTWKAMGVYATGYYSLWQRIA